MLKKAKKHFQLCLAPLETPHRGTFLLMTLAQPAADDAKPDIYAIMYQKPKWLLNYKVPDFKGGLFSESFSISKQDSNNVCCIFWKWGKCEKKKSAINPLLGTYKIAPMESYLAFNDPPRESLVVLE